MPLLFGAAIRLLPVAPLRLVVAPRPATPLTRSHSQIICQHALAFGLDRTATKNLIPLGDLRLHA